MEEAKEVHKCLRTAAGIFTAVKVFRLFLDTSESDALYSNARWTKTENILFQQLLLIDNHVTRACDSSLWLTHGVLNAS